MTGSKRTTIHIKITFLCGNFIHVCIACNHKDDYPERLEKVFSSHFFSFMLQIWLGTVYYKFHWFADHICPSPMSEWEYLSVKEAAILKVKVKFKRQLEGLYGEKGHGKRGMVLNIFLLLLFSLPMALLNVTGEEVGEGELMLKISPIKGHFIRKIILKMYI